MMSYMHGRVHVHMHVSDVIVQNFGTKFLLRRGECKTREIPISGKMAKSSFQLKIQNLFSISRMTKRISSLESSREI